jgi:hypothetical protein
VKSVRGWIALLATTSFLAGTASGVLLSEGLREPPPESGPFSTYRRMLVERFELDPERESLLADLLWHYHRRIEDLKFETAREELARLGEEYRAEVRRIIPPARQAEFDRLVTPAPPTP